MLRIAYVSSSLLVMGLIGSSTLLFPQYSNSIKESFNLPQTSLAVVSTVKDFATNLGSVTALVAVFVPQCVLLITASVVNLLANLTVWLYLSRNLNSITLPTLSICLFSSSFGLKLAETAILEIFFINFQVEAEYIWSFATALTDLGGGLESHVLGSSKGTLIILINGILPSILIVISSFFLIEDMNRALGSLTRTIQAFTCLAILLLIPLPPKAFIVIICLLAMVIFLAIRADLKTSSTEQTNRNSFELEHDTNTDAPKASLFSKAFSLNFCVLFILGLCGFGTNCALFDNLGQICESLGYDLKRTERFIMLACTWKFLGKISARYISQKIRENYRIPITVGIFVNLFLSSVGYLCLGFPFSGSVYISVILAGMSTGAMSQLSFDVLLDLFGEESMLRLYNLVTLSSPLGSLIFNRLVTARIYESELMKETSSLMQKNSTARLTCMGHSCFGTSFKLMAIVTLFGALFSLILVKRTWALYKGRM